MEISRRTLLTGTAALAAMSMLPVQPGIAAGMDLSTRPDLLGFAVGTPGEWNWRNYLASSAEEAWRMWSSEQGVPPAEMGEFDSDYVERVPAWDGRDNIGPADWLRAGLGHHCSRCDSETHVDCGGRVVREDVVCEECMTLGERLLDDDFAAFDDLVCDIVDEGAETVQQRLERMGDWPLIAGDLWTRAVAEAAA